MTVFDWLVSPGGQEFTHAAVILIVAIAGYFSYRAHATSTETKKQLNGHLADHEIRDTPTINSEIPPPTPKG